MSNKAAWCMAQGGKFEVRDAPMPKAEPGYVIVRNSAVAINPADWRMRETGYMTPGWPTILGGDIAGEVVEIGEGVTGYQKGDRVAGLTTRISSQKNEEGGFQFYTVMRAGALIKIPDDMSFEDAVVMSASVYTAAAALYDKKLLAMDFPSAGRSKDSAGYILIWGGSSSIGCAAIQLAKISGATVVATASAHNFDLCKTLGATAVFDHNSSTIVQDIVNELKGKKFIGAFDCISKADDTVRKCADITSQLGGGAIACTGSPPGSGLPENVNAQRISVFAIFANEIGPEITSSMPQMLCEKIFLPYPRPDVYGKGLGAIEEGLDKSKAGVSGRKLVVTL